MPADYYFDAYNGETGAELSLRETGRRDLYYVMQMIMSITDLKGYPCSGLDWDLHKRRYYSNLECYKENPAFYKQRGYESPEDYAFSYSKDVDDGNYVAWSGSIDLKKIWEWFEKSSQKNELIEEKSDVATENMDDLTEDSDSNLEDRHEYIDPYQQLKKGFELALTTKGHVTMLK